MEIPKYKIFEVDPLLMPFQTDIEQRVKNYQRMREKLLVSSENLSSFANGHLYFGFHQTEEGWYYREWIPNATKVCLFGDFNGWNPSEHRLKKKKNGIWEIFVEGKDTIKHGSKVKVKIWTDKKSFDRIPLYIKRAVQNPDNTFDGQIWQPDISFEWTDGNFNINKKEPLLIYEAHVGMSGEKEGIATYTEFTDFVLPRVKKLGYNAIQLMAVMEHPYYGSFGYQVSNFFAVSSRFGTPDELKKLIDTAHNMGIAVFLDIVHSHAASNTDEGIAAFDGTDYQFFHVGAKGSHPAWGTKLFNYGKPEVIHFLLSNIKFWLDEYHFDGFRFDGVTSMLYHDHGLGSAFDNYKKYFSLNTDTEAVTYLQLASELCREVNPDCVLIAEDMSGMPGMCLPVEWGGIGFDYRLSMGTPDFWINTLKKKKDEQWNMWQLWHELNQRRPEEKVIGYCESHDQALVGDKTLMFWLADKEMYYNMDINSNNLIIDRAVALHKMIRLITCLCAGDGYLNFMGNEFGHPEWIDFPRKENGWSYKHARRLWSIADDENLRFRFLQYFDEAMISLVKKENLLAEPSKPLYIDEKNEILVFSKGNYLFAFNFHPTRDYTETVKFDTHTEYTLVLNSNEKVFGGYEDKKEETIKTEKKENIISKENTLLIEKEYFLKIPIYNRTALIYKKIK